MTELLKMAAWVESAKISRASSGGFSVGDCAEVSRTFTADDFVEYAKVSGDNNPVHVDAEYAAAHPFLGVPLRIAQGQLVASSFSMLLGTQLPGAGTIYMSQTSRFMAPVREGDTVVMQVKITAIGEKGKATLECIARIGDLEVIVGEAQVKLPRPPKV